MTEFPKRAALKATPLLTVILAVLLAYNLRAEATMVKDIRFGDNKDYIRMVMEFDRPLNPPPSFSIQRHTLQVTLTGVAVDLPDRPPREYHADIISLAVSGTPQATRIDAAFSFAPADVKTFSLTGPDRFIVDAYRPLSTAAPGPPVEDSGQAASIEKTMPLPEPHRPAEILPPTDGSPPIEKTSIQPDGAAPSLSSTAEDLRRHRFQQRLIAALIVVTSIIVVLLIFLIWMGAGRKNPPAPSWVQDLPPTRDRNIENIDSVIGEHLKNHDHR